jgi:IMP dehydrogenase
MTLGCAPSAEVLIDEINSELCASYIHAGALNLAEFADRAVVGIQPTSRYA